MTNTQREAIPMPTRDEIRKALNTIDLAICAAEDMGTEVLSARQLNSMREAYEALDWFIR